MELLLSLNLRLSVADLILSLTVKQIEIFALMQWEVAPALTSPDTTCINPLNCKAGLWTATMEMCCWCILFTLYSSHVCDDPNNEKERSQFERFLTLLQTEKVHWKVLRLSAIGLPEKNTSSDDKIGYKFKV